MNREKQTNNHHEQSMNNATEDLFFITYKSMPGISWVELCQCAGGNPLQHLFGEDPEQLPTDIQRLEDGPILVIALGNEIFLELGQELEVEQIVRGKSFLTNHSFHGLDVLPDGVAGIKLVGHIRMILAGHACNAIQGKNSYLL